MLTMFLIEGGSLARLDEPREEARESGSLWLDLCEPSAEERSQVENLGRQRLSQADVFEEIEASSRSYVDADGLHLSSLFLRRSEGRDQHSSEPDHQVPVGGCRRIHAAHAHCQRLGNEL